MTNAERKILAVLDAIKAIWDLHPKKGYSEDGGMGYSYRHHPGQMEISPSQLIRESGLRFEEVIPILHKLREEGLLTEVETYNEAM